jgi:hypothetical protein
MEVNKVLSHCCHSDSKFAGFNHQSGVLPAFLLGFLIFCICAVDLTAKKMNRDKQGEQMDRMDLMDFMDSSATGFTGLNDV